MKWYFWKYKFYKGWISFYFLNILNTVLFNKPGRQDVPFVALGYKCIIIHLLHGQLSQHLLYTGIIIITIYHYQLTFTIVWIQTRQRPPASWQTWIHSPKSNTPPLLVPKAQTPQIHTKPLISLVNCLINVWHLISKHLRMRDVGWKCNKIVCVTKRNRWMRNKAMFVSFWVRQ